MTPVTAVCHPGKHTRIHRLPIHGIATVQPFSLSLPSSPEHATDKQPSVPWRPHGDRKTGRGHSNIAARTGELMRPLHGRYARAGQLVDLPFCIFNVASPLISMLWGFTGFKIGRMQSAAVTQEPVPAP
jgi:hypothetical protein